MLVAARVWLAN